MTGIITVVSLLAERHVIGSLLAERPVIGSLLAERLVIGSLLAVHICSCRQANTSMIVKERMVAQKDFYQLA